MTSAKPMCFHSILSEGRAVVSRGGPVSANVRPAGDTRMFSGQVMRVGILAAALALAGLEASSGADYAIGASIRSVRPFSYLAKD